MLTWIFGGVIETVHNIRVARPLGLVGEYHPFAARVKD